MIHRSLFTVLGTVLGLLGAAPVVLAQSTQIVPGIPNADLTVKGPSGGARGGRIFTPNSGTAPGRMHTNYKIFVPNRAQSQGKTGAAAPGPVQYQSAGNPPYAGYYFETPASLACIYGLVAPSAGCDPNIVKMNAPGGVKAIGIVALDDDTSALADLQAYSQQFGLPTPKLSIYYVGGAKPRANSDYAYETSLDLDMAHAMSPNAPIILVEGPQTNAADFGLSAVFDLAIQKVQAAGGGVVSASYGTPEFATEANYESHFTNATGVVLFASSGDDPSVSWPSVSPNVISVGGTGTAREMQITTSRGPTATPTFGQFKEEVAWDQGGGGFSKYFAIPSYQSSIAVRTYNRSMRTTPDVAAVADPATAVWVYCTTGCGFTAASGWQLTGGTSVASPLTASMTANMGQLTPTTTTALQLQYIYSQIGAKTYFDVAKGTCGPSSGFTVTTGTAASPANQYDLCTGVGSPRYTPVPNTASASAAR